MRSCSYDSRKQNKKASPRVPILVNCPESRGWFPIPMRYIYQGSPESRRGGWIFNSGEIYSFKAYFCGVCAQNPEFMVTLLRVRAGLAISVELPWFFWQFCDVLDVVIRMCVRGSVQRMTNDNGSDNFFFWSAEYLFFVFWCKPRSSRQSTTYSTYSSRVWRMRRSGDFQCSERLR